MFYTVDDTIAALASAPGNALRGVIRVSGPATLACVQPCFRAESHIDLPTSGPPRIIPGHWQLDEPMGRVPVDLCWWPTTRSYTRQVAAELHSLGCPPVLDAILQQLCDSGARLAQPGEFTLRAFLAGRLDLTQAEAVLGVVDAQDTRSLQTALQQLAGGLAGPLANMRSDLLDLLADLEAGLDFADEDIAFVQAPEMQQRIDAAIQTAHEVLTQISSRSVTNQQPRVVLRGWPNVGKSSLLNALAGDDVAIVCHEAGTTRDYVTRPFQWHGISGLLVDTAGLQERQWLDALGTAAQQAADTQQRQADLELLCFDASRPLHVDEQALLPRSEEPTRLVVWTKIDAGNVHPYISENHLSVSSWSGEGLERLRQRICDRLLSCSASPTSVVASTAQRCRHSLLELARHLQSGRELVAQALGDELVAVELRSALHHLGQVVGAVYTDDILDRVFSRFCIGK